MVLVDGRVLVEDFRVLTVDEKQVARDAQRAADRVAEAAKEPFESLAKTPLRGMMRRQEL